MMPDTNPAMGEMPLAPEPGTHEVALGTRAAAGRPARDGAAASPAGAPRSAGKPAQVKPDGR